MNKELIQSASDFVKKASAKLAEMETSLNEKNRVNECFKLAAHMMDRGIIESDNFMESVENLINSGKEISVLKEAVAMNSGRSGLTLTMDGAESVDADSPVSGSALAKAAAISKIMGE